MAKDKELVAKEEAGALAMFQEDAGLGFEEADGKCYAIPFLRILQSGSPQCKKSEPEYIKGAEEGHFIESVSQEVFKEETGILFVPCYFIRKFNLWAPRGTADSGFKGSMSAAEGEALLSQCTKDDKNHDITPDGYILTDTREHYGIMVKPDGNYEPVVLCLVSTQLKKSKNWMTFMRSQKLPSGAEAPMFSHIYRLTTVPESNDMGSWFGLKWADEGFLKADQGDIYQAAKNFREMIRSGAAKPVEESSEEVPF